MLPLIIRDGKRAQLTKARKYHRCGMCQGDINKGEDYYAITTNGSGLSSTKFPQRVHPVEIEDYFERRRRNE